MPQVINDFRKNNEKKVIFELCGQIIIENETNFIFFDFFGRYRFSFQFKKEISNKNDSEKKQILLSEKLRKILKKSDNSILLQGIMRKYERENRIAILVSEIRSVNFHTELLFLGEVISLRKQNKL